ncbi:MAG: tRNA uridine-5-carboxymethylaminomethyl(34) synthesis GTPase MnmE [Pseudomonadales bacterium]|nr:tRNA uridine-5-carboxymethylaminomethyl(34) synthesis GTPase MnmE [Pseudomonadales bacterium]
MAHVDTIVAAATPAGRGGVAIVRVSGPRVPEIAATLLGILPQPRTAVLTAFPDERGDPIDVGIALFFPGPHSYTGEHVVELQGHGGPVVVENLVARVVALGARRAQPGEFTLRAYLNDKIDLAQAEAVADLIDAGSTDAARAAMRSLQGEFSTMVAGLTEAVIEVRTYVEAAIDFPEEEVDFLADTELAARLAHLREHVAAVAASARQGRLLRDGMTVVLAGRPNAGKSSLLNRLAGYDAAIVTPIPGTTRDVVRERIAIDGMPLHVLDTAGLREAQDAVEHEGVRRAHAEMAKADGVLFVIDSAADPEAGAYHAERASLPANVPVTLLFNKIDLVDALPLANTQSGPRRIAVSATTGQGLELLRTHLKQAMQFQTPESGSISARQRHSDALARAARHVDAAVELLRQRRAGELMAEELRAAQRALDEITGVFSSDDLLGRIFGSFCIGK